MQNISTSWLIGIGAAIVLIIALFFFIPRAAVAPTLTSTSTGQSASTTSVDLGNGTTVQVPAGVTITPVANVQEPNLNHQVSYSPSLPPDAIAALKLDVASTTAHLKTHPTDGQYWLQLAVDYKIAGDYTAAESVWIYMTKVAPTSYIAYGDLGDLYMNFLVNYPKAEANYLQAIKLNPHYVGFYSDLFTLYRSFYKVGTGAAQAIVAEGLKNNPGNAELLQLQQQK